MDKTQNLTWPIELYFLFGLIFLFIFILVKAPKALKNLIEQFETSIAENDDIVSFEFTFYWGFFTYEKETTVSVKSSKKALDKNLKKCFYFNLKWCCLSRAILFIIPLTKANISKILKENS